MQYGPDNLTFCNCTLQCACLGARSAPVSAWTCNCIQCMCNCICLALPVQGHAVVYSAALCAILDALSCQCKEVHSRAEMPEACSLCWLAEAVTPYFLLSSTKFCNSDPPSAMPVKYMLVKPLAVHIISQLFN